MLKKRMAAGWVLLGVFTLAAVAACGGAESKTAPLDNSNSSGGTGTGGLLGEAGGLNLAGEGNAGAGDVSGVDPNLACATETAEAKPAELDMALLVDTSQSMDFADKWRQVSSAIKVFVADPRYAELGVALQFFPESNFQCSVSGYAVPKVPMAPLAESGDAIVDAVNAQRMDKGTPIVPVLEGMSTYVGGLPADGGRRRVIVLATDGIPDDSCTESSRPRPNTIAEAVKLAGELAKQEPPLRTFVIGVGSDLEGLNSIAAAGGTDAAIIISTGADVQEKFLAALAKVRRTSLPCDYAIPKPTKGTLDLGKVNVLLTVPGSAKQTLLYTGGDAKCADADSKGWYFDSLSKPTKVVLCPDTCEAVKAVDGARVDTAFGCKRQDVIVR